MNPRRTHQFLAILFACLGGGFDTACLSAGEPSTLTATPAATTNAPTTRVLDTDELLTLLTETLQREHVKTKGELELRLTRPWPRLTVPAEPLTLKVTELPTAGLTANCIVRFELRTDERKLGEWQSPLNAKIWREVWVARTQLKRGEPVAGAEVARERRDVINVREPLADFSATDPALEFAEPITQGATLLARAVKLKTVIRRGQLADALLEDGTLRVTMKVEALEDGAPGQLIRARNPQTRRDLRGKVLNEQTLLLSL